MKDVTSQKDDYFERANETAKKYGHSLYNGNEDIKEIENGKLYQLHFNILVNKIDSLDRKQHEQEKELKGCKTLVYLLLFAICILGILLMNHSDKI